MRTDHGDTVNTVALHNIQMVRVVVEATERGGGQQVEMQRVEQGEEPSQQPQEPSMQDVLHTMLGEIRDTRATIESLEERMMSMEVELAT